MAKGASNKITSSQNCNGHELERRYLLVKGVVQGVGFRPFIYRIACEESLAGLVRNTSKGVEIEIQGMLQQLERFMERLQEELPPLAEIDSIDSQDVDTIAEDTVFSIVSSHAEVKGNVRIPADIKVCDDCSQEIIDSNDRHYYYPLTNCTNCGPRFTVIRDVPYDRQLTTMEPFSMCQACEEEYSNPLDRRFHAQPTACPECGPKTSLLKQDGSLLAEGANGQALRSVIKDTTELLAAGNIVAIKGIGGFHFCCDANNDIAVETLRERKRRPSKPLAVMARNIVMVKQRLVLSDKEQQVLTGKQAPIVILDKKDILDFQQVAPDLNTVGVMLPYTPLHHLLFAEGDFDWLVMTSANSSNMPITIDNKEALEGLRGFVDYYLMHERDIEQRCDDSLVRVINDKIVAIRRSRGYTPDPIKVPVQTDEVILAVGGEMKNTFAFHKNDQAILSQYIGEIDSWEGRQNFLHSIGHFERLFDLQPSVVAYDKHPSYQVSEIAKLLDYSKIEVQHHHAHMASCMAEHRLEGKTLGIILDGTGYGDDQTLWGSEFLVGDYKGYERVARGQFLPVVGGERAIKEPWRMAVSVLLKTKKEIGMEIATELWPEKTQEIALISQMIDKKIQTINSSGMGRLFDAVSALLGICTVSTYEGEAAIRLANCAERFSSEVGLREYQVEMQTIEQHDGTGGTLSVLNWLPMLEEIIDDVLTGKDKEEIAFCFHKAVAMSLIQQALQVTEQHNINQIVLSGGTWHNELLLKWVSSGLEGKGFNVYWHERVPTNDSGIALGQLMIAAAIMKS